MDGLSYLLTGGFLKGYRTYLMAALAAASALTAYAVGDANLTQTITAVGTALGMSGLRSAVNS